MAGSKANTVAQYLSELPEDRREALARVRETILAALPAGYVESMAFGMIGYAVPLDRYPDTYNKQPLAYVGLAAQKNYNTLYLMSAYADSDDEARLRRAFDEAGKKLDFGKSCIRFRKPDDLPLDAIGAIIASHPVEEWIARYEAVQAGRKK